MKTEKKSFKHESIQNSQKIEKILQAISAGIAKGEIKFSDEEDEIVFNPEGLMKLKISAAQDNHQQNFTIKVSWLVDSAELENKSLKINQ